MGEVYRARDARLERDVALKVLPEPFASDAGRLARFQREAHLLAALDHPNIATIYGFEEAHGLRALVLELVDGPTLADRIARGPIPLADALTIARQIVDALDAAHQKGIIHRDLKPANIKTRPDGSTKVLDFGVAKILDRAPGETITRPPDILDSIPGTVLGTAAYMSPEQARGQAVDRRTDVWAFGCVLFEMLTGCAAFQGETGNDIVAAVLHAEPDWTQLPADTPEAIRRLLRRCLQKDGRLRLHDVADVRLELDEASTPPQADVRAPRTRLSRRERVFGASIALAIVTAVAAIAWARWAVHAAAEAPEMRLAIPTPSTTDPVSFAISPDGREVAFVATIDGRPRLWLRSLHDIAARPLPGTDFAAHPFWSPDSRSIGFFANQKLMRLDIAGGIVQSLNRVEVGLGGTWTRDGAILFSARPGGPIFRISDSGGDATAVSQVQPPQVGHRFPYVLPDGRHFLYYVAGTTDTRGVYVDRIDGSGAQKLVSADSAAAYAPPGYLLFMRQSTLYAQRFDPVAIVLSGRPLPVAERVAVDQGFGRPGVSAATTGTVLYRETGNGGTKQYIWFNRKGQAIGTLGQMGNTDLAHASLAPDGHRIAMALAAGGNSDLWVLDTTRGTVERFTTDPANDVFPVWSPDGSQIVFGSNRRASGAPELYVKSTTSTAPEELLAPALSGRTAIPDDWSPDGRFIVFRDISPKGGYDLWALPVKPVGTPFPVVQTQFEELGAQFSPDGKWIAYQSDETGVSDVYIQPFPGPGRRTQISPSGGSQVRWNRNGRELFYVALDGHLMSVPIRAVPDGTTLDVGTPIPLFETRIVGGLPGQGNHRQQYMVSSDGERFLIHSVAAEDASPIIAVLNWKPGS